MKKNIFLLFLIFIVLCSVLFVSLYKLRSCWVKYDGNPVLGDLETGSLFDPNVLKIDNKFYIFVSDRKNKSIIVYDSLDGISWNNRSEVLKNNLDTGWEADVNRCCVIYQDGKYKMWYTGQQNGKSCIGYAESYDLHNFHRIQSEPILKPEEDYETEAVMNPYVMYDNSESIYRMWYAAGQNYEPDVIAYAESHDGINWIKYVNNPILTSSKNVKDYDSYKVGGCEVKYINNKYCMFYIGYTNINTAYIMCASSEDGLTNWKRTMHPIISPSSDKFDSNACYKPTVYYDTSKSTLMLWYNGRNDYTESIGLATFRIK